MVSGVTAKQEAFARAVIEGRSLSDAYRSAYDCSRMKTSTINRKASELMANGKIAAIVERARARAAEAAGWSAAVAMGRMMEANAASLSAIVSDGETKQADVNAFLGTVDRLNALSGVSSAQDAGADAPVFVFEREGR